ncbi:phosphomannomutase/phosphoglucomutase [Marinobacter profundi]|uniref:phosphomannomutase n=1 Tax=Marinobacter profundi TaxID=2666256 RepID=A0A2G1UI41_9GAMM|nr:phosphomannomutase/phosphoglucomutase [Marinobacter profundi]PHQ14115.1 phosphomannomutase [Marinobacter profundi]
MKLGRKKAGGDAAPDQPDKQLTQNNNRPAPAGSRHRGLSAVALVQAAVVGVAGVVATVLLWFFAVVPATEQQAAERAALELDHAVRRVSQQLDLMQQVVSGVATQPHVRELLTTVAADLEPEPQLAGFLPGVREAHLFPVGAIPRSVEEASTAGFASLDLARQAESGGPLRPDAFPRNGQWLIQFAAPLAGDGQGPVAGTLLVLFEAAALMPVLQPVDSRLGGRLELVQTVSGNASVVASRGSANGSAMERRLPMAGWSLRYTPAFELSAAISPGLALVLALVPAIVAAALVWMLLGSARRGLRTDLAELIQWSHKTFSGERTRLPDLRWDMFATLGEVLQRLSQLVDKRLARGAGPARAVAPGDSGEPAPADEVAAPAEEPMFQDRDMLDMDMLDGDEDVLGFGGEATAERSPAAASAWDLPPAAAPEVPQEIFRAYDIRGIVGESLTAEVVQLIGRALGSEAVDRGLDTLCVGYDGRHSSPELANALARGIMSTGCDVIRVGAVPTPVLYFATHQLETGSGVMVTGSHNPANYNGLKMMLGGETLSGDAIQQLYQRIQAGNFVAGQGSSSDRDVRRDYLDRIVGDIAVAAPLKVVLDAGNGIAGELAPILVEELGCDVIPLYCEVDGDFPNHHPDPGKPENLADLIARVRAENADIGLAFDGDGDRLGVVTRSGKIIWPDRLMMLFARDVVSRNPGADVLYDVKCSRRLAAVINEAGGRPIMWKTGHSLMKAKMKETGALLAGEMSGHIFFAERWYGFDDGLYSAARLLEILGVEERSSDEVFEDFPEDISTPELNVAVTEASKFDIVERLSRDGSFGEGSLSTIDGVRVDYPDGWGLCRASNTTPVLVLRFEAETEQALERIKGVFREQLHRIAPDVIADF